ncbi:hypothetical protein [Nocardia sp. NPDC051570]|uniref:hypothetical protein n=1 Tax=Nocardia sp. NPDC051570 TaxID=3364324 RepID=UPI00378B20BB
MTTPLALSYAREVVKGCLDLPALIDLIGDADELVSGGVNSGEIIRIAQRCEEILDRALTSDELTGIDTITAVAALLGNGNQDKDN